MLNETISDEINKREFWLPICDRENIEAGLSFCQKRCRKNVISVEDVIRLATVITRLVRKPAGMIIVVYPGEPTRGYGRTKKEDQQIHIIEVTTSYTLEWDERGTCAVINISREAQRPYPAELIRPPYGMTGSEIHSMLGDKMSIPEDYEPGVFY